MSRFRYRAVPALNQHNDESIPDTIDALKENVEVLTRQRKPIEAAAVTWQDLVDLGLITPTGYL
jgi:hypothetical protein